MIPTGEPESAFLPPEEAEAIEQGLERAVYELHPERNGT